MAVYCGVCAVRLSNATENGGAFLSADFGGWDKGYEINATCERCCLALRKAVSEAARSLIKSRIVKARVADLKRSVAEEEQSRKTYGKSRREALDAFETDWHLGKKKPRAAAGSG